MHFIAPLLVICMTFTIWVYLNFNVKDQIVTEHNLNLSQRFVNDDKHLLSVTAKVTHGNRSFSHENKDFTTHNSSIQNLVETIRSNESSIKCTYEKDITVYMDAFTKLTDRFFGLRYQEFLLKSQECKSLPGGGRCLFNYDNKHSDAILYYGVSTEFHFERIFEKQIVVVFTMEAESGRFCHFPPPSKYDIKISYKRNSTIPYLFLCYDNQAKRMLEMGKPNVSAKNKKLVASFTKNCAPNYKWRTNYFKELMKYVHVDQWGKCLRNTPGDFWKTRANENFTELKIDFLRKNPYKFLLAFENTVDGDYITEKIYDAYLSHTIPIFYGDKSVFDLVPGKSTFIYANDYTPKQLAELIKRIDNNDTLYRQYFNWDLSIIRELDEKYCSEYFMCRLCEKVWELLYNRKCGIK